MVLNVGEIKIDRKLIFKKAHRNAKKVTKENPGVSYRAQLSIALKFLYEEIKIKQVAKTVQNFYSDSLKVIEKATLKEVNNYVSVVEAARKEFKSFKPELVIFDDQIMLLNLFNDLDFEISDRIEEIKEEINYYWINKNLLEVVRDLKQNNTTIEAITGNVMRALYMLGLNLELNFGIYTINNKEVGNNILDVYGEIKNLVV